MKVHFRGYSSQGQFPLYLDGIPIPIAYDGRLDFSRFFIIDIAEIDVAKGYSSLSLGANNLGGFINLVSRQPKKMFESEATLGAPTMTMTPYIAAVLALANVSSNRSGWGFRQQFQFIRVQGQSDQTVCAENRKQYQPVVWRCETPHSP